MNIYKQRNALRDALRKVIKVSDDFVKETGLKHGDPLTDAVDEARDVLADCCDDERPPARQTALDL